MDKELLPYIDALHSLQTWGLALLGIGTVLLVLMVVVYIFGSREKVVRCRSKALLSIAFIGASLVVGFSLIGTIPWSSQKIQMYVSTYHDIYRFPNYIGVPIWMIAFSQHVLTIAGMIAGYSFLSSISKPSDSGK